MRQGLEGQKCHYCIRGNIYRPGTRQTPPALGPLESLYCPALVSSPYVGILTAQSPQGTDLEIIDPGSYLGRACTESGSSQPCFYRRVARSELCSAWT